MLTLPRIHLEIRSYNEEYSIDRLNGIRKSARQLIDEPG